MALPKLPVICLPVNSKERQLLSFSRKLNSIILIVNYFSRSAHWSQRSREFMQTLTQVYNNISTDLKNEFEVVFLSWDNERSIFETFYKEMPWKAIPYSGNSLFL